jgi:hypothetical protein
MNVNTPSEEDQALKKRSQAWHTPVVPPLWRVMSSRLA